MIQDLETALKTISDAASLSSSYSLDENEELTEALHYIWDFMLSKLEGNEEEAGYEIAIDLR
jgi:hypothetical protein